MLLAMVLREGARSARIDAVFDDHRNLSIKNSEREKRGAEWAMKTKAFSLIIEYSSREGFCQTQRTSSN